MKRTLIIIVLISVLTVAKAQEKAIGIHGGAGTSWIAMPKTYISGDAGLTNADFVLSNASNNATAYLGVALYKQIKTSGFYFAPEFNLNYLSGEIVLQAVDKSTVQGVASVKGVQRYLRAEVPFIFTAENDDNIAIMLGPVFYANLYNNKIIEEMAAGVSKATVNGSKPVGWAMRVGFSWFVNDNMRWLIKWDIDQNKRNFIKYEDNQYNVRLSSQSITIGFGYFFMK